MLRDGLPARYRQRRPESGSVAERLQTCSGQHEPAAIQFHFDFFSRHPAEFLQRRPAWRIAGPTGFFASFSVNRFLLARPCQWRAMTSLTAELSFCRLGAASQPEF